MEIKDTSMDGTLVEEAENWLERQEEKDLANKVTFIQGSAYFVNNIRSRLHMVHKSLVMIAALPKGSKDNAPTEVWNGITPLRIKHI